jgi:hypothetical protein
VPKRTSKKKRKKRRQEEDVNQLAYRLVQESTSNVVDISTKAQGTKNPAAVALGRLGGLKGGKARMKKLSPERRREIAMTAARTRWAKDRSD